MPHSRAQLIFLLCSVLNPAGKTAKPEQFIGNSLVAELEKSGFIEKLYKP
jgi:hypothetical protein